jgi:hypothetical protein
MAPISRGFRGRPRRDADPARIPPGQYVVDDFPVLSAGPTPRTPLDEWSFTISGAVDQPVSWPWQDFLALPNETFTVDIHCVTKWSKLATTWTGVSLDTLLEGVESEAEYISAWCDGGYTTNPSIRGSSCVARRRSSSGPPTCCSSSATGRGRSAPSASGRHELDGEVLPVARRQCSGGAAA